MTGQPEVDETEKADIAGGPWVTWAANAGALVLAEFEFSLLFL